MQALISIPGRCVGALVGLASLPARRLTEFVDANDDLWAHDPFLDDGDAW